MTSRTAVTSKPLNWLIAIGFGAAVGGAVYCSTQSAPAKAVLNGSVAAAFAVIGWKKQQAEMQEQTRAIFSARPASRTPRL